LLKNPGIFETTRTYTVIGEFLLQRANLLGHKAALR